MAPQETRPEMIAPGIWDSNPCASMLQHKEGHSRQTPFPQAPPRPRFSNSSQFHSPQKHAIFTQKNAKKCHFFNRTSASLAPFALRKLPSIQPFRARKLPHQNSLAFKPTSGPQMGRSTRSCFSTCTPPTRGSVPMSLSPLVPQSLFPSPSVPSPSAPRSTGYHLH